MSSPILEHLERAARRAVLSVSAMPLAVMVSVRVDKRRNGRMIWRD